MKHSRRTFFKQGLAGALLLGTSTIAQAALPDPVKPKAPKAVNPFHLGMAGYTFVNFDLDTTLKTLERLDIHYLCIKDFHLPLNSTDEQIRAFHDKCAAHKVTGYDFHYAIHLHGPDIKTYPDATDVWEHTKDLDPRIGMCLDVGHDLRNGCDPVADLKKYHTRVFDMHIKDVTDSSKAGVGIEIGRGKIDFPALIRMMREVNYTGMCSLEYEKDMKDPFLGIAESIGYFKAVSDLT